MSVTIVDDRPQRKPKTIPAYTALPGQLYQTVGGSVDLVIMAIYMPADAYGKAFPESQHLAFLSGDGRAYPCTTSELIPLEGTITWTVTAGGEDQCAYEHTSQDQKDRLKLADAYLDIGREE